MRFGVKKETVKEVTDVHNILKLYDYNCNINAADFRTKISEIINPCIDGKFVPLLFELRGNYEIVAVGPINAILDFFKISIAGEYENGFELGVKKEGETELRRNPKAPNYFANICNYDRKLTSKLKRDYFKLSEDEHLYFYRSKIKLLNEEQTAKEIKDHNNYENFNSFAIHTIRRQVKFHKIFNLPYNLNINVTLIDDDEKYKTETSLSFKIEDDNSISLSGTHEHVYSFIDENIVNVNFNIKENNTIDIDCGEDIENTKWSLKDVLANTFRNTRTISSFTQ